MKDNHPEGSQHARHHAATTIRLAVWGAVALSAILAALVVSRVDALTAVLTVVMFALATGSGIR